jgi:steroid delta-isomerase-like uncharacterized protein
MSVDPKALTRRFFEERNKGKAAAVAVIDETCATNMVFHNSTGRDIYGLKDFQQYYSELFSAYPDIHFTIDDMITEGNKVATRYTMTGTNKGEFMGIPPTNKKMGVWVIEIDHVARGKIVEGWLRFDTMGWMQQLGVVPAPKKRK